MGIVQSSEVGLPITVADAKEHLRVTDTEDDEYIRRLIVASYEYAQTATRQQLQATNYVETWDFFPRVIEPNRWPLRSVTSIGYTDENGTTQTLSSTAFQVDTSNTPGRIAPTADEVTWPVTEGGTFNAVTVSYTAGQSSVTAFDVRAKVGMLMLIGHWYKQREEVVVGATAMEIPTMAKSLFQSMKTSVYP